MATIIISLLMLCLIAAVVFHMLKNKKQGKSSCGCGCSDCAASSICHGNTKTTK